MLCCANCFGDSFLNKYIGDIATETGNCSFCETTSVPVVNPRMLSDFFESVCSIYREDSSEFAKSLVDWLVIDWELFENLDSIKARALLGEILDNGEIVRKTYVPNETEAPNDIEVWNCFCEEIKKENRFFFKNEIEENKLKQLFESYLCADASPFDHLLYRARIQSDDSIILLEDMGKPPAKIAKSGRINPVGIPCLYTATTIESSIAETRPHPNDILTVAKFEVKEEFKKTLLLLNLKNPRKTISPFAVNDSILLTLRLDLDFLCNIEDILSKPILPRVAELEYLPTQYLSEFIKNCNYDGVIYKSSVSEGDNVAIFNDEKLIPIETTQHKVINLNYEYISLST